MIETQEIKNGFVILTATDGIIHKIGTDEYHPSLIMPPSETVDMYEEVTEQPAYTQAEYETKVAELIAERYSPSEETSLINNFLDIDPTQSHIDEYREYQAFRAECKQRAKDVSLYQKEEDYEDSEE